MFNFRKKTAIIALVGTLVLSTVPAFAQNKGISVKLNGETVNFDVPAMIINDRTMVPMRGIFEKLGFNVHWDAAEKSITAEGSSHVFMKIGSNEMNVDEDRLELDTPPQIVEGRTLIPLRALAEGIGCSVEWNKDTRTVDIYYANNYSLYKSILEGTQKAYEYSEYLWYYLYDIDGNGVKELIVQTGDFEAEFMWEIYSIWNKKDVALLGMVGGSHTAFYPCEEGVLGVYKHYTHRGSEALYRITVEGMGINEELLWDIPEPHSEMWSTPENYSEYATFDPGDMISAPITDFSLLK